MSRRSTRRALALLTFSVITSSLVACAAPPSASTGPGEQERAEVAADAAAAASGDSLDRLLPGDVILDGYSGDPTFDDQRDTYGASFTHAMIYVGERDGRHMVVEAVGATKKSRLIAIEDKVFRFAKIVRVDGASDSQRAAAASLAAKDYVGVPYAWDIPITRPIPAPEELVVMRAGLKKTRTDRLYCSSLVWNAWYNAARIDLDSDYVGTWGMPSNALVMPKSHFVMPDDIAMSDKVKYVIRVDLPKGEATPPQDAKTAVVPDVMKMYGEAPEGDPGDWEAFEAGLNAYVNKQLAPLGLTARIEWSEPDVPGSKLGTQDPPAGSVVPRGTVVTVFLTM